MEQTNDVVVVGAGPVGMTAAALLAARGVGVHLVERRRTTSDTPKAISLDDESLRTYQQAGVEARVMDVIVPGTGTAYYDADDELLFRGGARVPLRLGYPYKNPFAQPDLERVLRTALEDDSRVQLDFGTSTVGLDQNAEGVTVHVSGPEDTNRRALRARYVLAADGGRSTVRSLLDVPMRGRSHDEVWLVVDTVEDERSERYAMHHGDPRRPRVVVPGLAGRCRYEFLLEPGECPAGEAPPFAIIERLLRPYRSIRPEHVERAVAYTFHSLAADSWRRGRVFLLGDAAHMMPPFAGQGLNSGIRDAANLTWKVATALSGGASEELLDSYQTERAPHAEAVTRSSEKLGRLVFTRSERLARARDAVVRRAMATEDGRAFFEQMRYRPVARFRSGMVLGPDEHELVGTQVGQPQVFWLERRRTVLLDRLAGDGWALFGAGVDADAWALLLTALPHRTMEPVAVGATPPALVLVHVPFDDTMAGGTPTRLTAPTGGERPQDADSAGDGISAADGCIRVALDLDGRLYAELGAARGSFVLVRPDRFVAAVAVPEDVETLMTALRRWTTPAPAAAVG